VTNIALQQGINMRVRVLRGLKANGQRRVSYWGIGEPVDNYGAGNPPGFSAEATKQAAVVPTRLTRFSDGVQNLVMKAGYAHADAALRTSGLPDLIDSKPNFGSLPLLG